MIWFGSRANLQKIATADQSLRIDRDIIHSVASVHDLGVTLDSELTLQRHVNKVASACFLSYSSSEADLPAAWTWRCDQSCCLVSAFVLSRLDYCNAILAASAGLPKTTIAPLQRAQNAAARLLARLGPRDHVSNALRDLHWLPVQHRITYKLWLLMHLVHNNRSLWAAENATQIWRALLRLCWPGSLEQPSIISSRTNWYYSF